MYFGKFDEPYREEEKPPIWRRDKFWITGNACAHKTREKYISKEKFVSKVSLSFPVAIIGCYFLLIGFVILLLLLTPRFGMHSPGSGNEHENQNDGIGFYGSNPQKSGYYSLHLHCIMYEFNC